MMRYIMALIVMVAGVTIGAGSVAAAAPLRPTVEATYAASNRIPAGGDISTVIREYGTAECANFILSFGHTRDSYSRQTVQSVTQDGNKGKSVAVDESGKAETFTWEYTDRWRFTCEGILDGAEVTIG